MKAGIFNIHDYLGKLYENADEKEFNKKLNEAESSDGDNGPKESEGVIYPEGEKNKAYDWLKKEFQKGKTEVKVEMSSHEFKPGYHMENAPKSTKDFPGMYGQVKTGDTKGEAPKQSSFPETKFPGSETGDNSDDKIDNKDKNESGEEKPKKTNGISVEAKTKDKNESGEDKKKEKDKKEE